MKKILMSLVGLVLLLNLIGVISAITNDEVSYFFKHGESFDIKRECFYNGFPCDYSLFNCNITIYFENNSLFANDQVMTGNPNYYNYTVYNNAAPNGFYRCSMVCTDGINSGSEIFYFKINQTGDNRSLALFLILGIASFVVLAFAVIFQNEYMGFIAGALFIVTGVYVMIFGFSDLSDMYTRAIAYTCIGLGFIFEIAAGYKVAEETGITSGGVFSGDSWE